MSEQKKVKRYAQRWQAKHAPVWDGQAVVAWCARCCRGTRHRVAKGRRGACLDCVTALVEKPKPPVAEQMEFPFSQQEDVQ